MAGFGALSASQQIMVRLYLLGGPKYRAEMEKAGLVTKQLTAANTGLGKAMAITNRRSFLQNQLLFTARRAMFYTTLGTIALSAEVVRMGFAYDNAMQTASVALGQVIRPQRVLNRELQQLFQIAAGTPFQVKDITTAFRQMYISFKPFNVGMGTLNDTILAITNNLSATGKVTPASLQRVSTALSHMANVGHLTGMATLQLARDGLQLYPALSKELGITADQFADIGSLNISSRDVLMAIIKYSQTTPGIMNAAFRQSNKTLSGAASSLKDYISQAAGGALGGPGGQKGIFGAIQRNIVGVNKQLYNMSKAGKSITLMDVVKAIDKQLTPKTHILINTFIMFSTAVHTTITTIGVLIKIISFLLTPFDKLFGLFGSGQKSAKLMGIALGILGAIVVVGAAQWVVYKGAVDAVRVVMWGLNNAIIATTAAQKLQNILMGREASAGWLGRLGFGKKKVPVKVGPLGTVPAAKGTLSLEALLGTQAAKDATPVFGRLTKTLSNFFNPAKIGGFRNAMRSAVLTMKSGEWKVGLRIMASGIWALVPAFGAATAGAVAFFVANIWWFAIAAAIIGVALSLVILYRKWQWFHDLVNRSARFIKRYWELFLLAIPVFGTLAFVITQMIEHWKDFTRVLSTVVGWLRRVYDWVKKLSVVGWLGGLLHKVNVAATAVGQATITAGQTAGSVPGWLAQSSVKPTPRQHGGPIFGSGGLQIVGEAGPELVRLPGGSHVFPNSQLNNVQPVGFRGSGGGNERPIVVQVMLDRKVLAQGVARANQDYAARR
jgi:hypothetical protein